MGAVRNLFVRIGGDASGAVRGFKDASRAGANAEKSIKKSSAQTKRSIRETFASSVPSIKEYTAQIAQAKSVHQTETQNVGRLRDQVAELSKKYGEVKTIAAGLDMSTSIQKQIADTENLIESLGRKIEETKEKIDFAKATEPIGQQYSVAPLQAEFERLGEESDNAVSKLAELERIAAMMGKASSAKTLSAGLQEMEGELVSVQNELRTAQTLADEAKSKLQGMGVGVSAWALIKKEAQNAGTAFLGIGRAFQDVVQKDPSAGLANRLVRMGRSIKQIPANMLRGVAGGFNRISTAIRSIPEIPGRILSSLKNIGKSAAYAAGYGVGKLWGGLKKLGGGAVRGIASLPGKLRNIGRSASASTGGLTKLVRSIRNIGIASLGMRVAKGMFGQLRSIISNYVSQNEELNNSINSLKNQMGEALVPAINIVVAALQRIMPVVTAVSNGVSSIFKSLFGDIATTSKKLKSATQELNTYGFDQITKESDSESGSTSSGASQGGDQSALVTKLTGWLTKLKTAFMAGDWKTLGGTFADGINSALSALGKLDIGSKIGDVGNAIMTTLHSLLRGIDFRAIGGTLGRQMTDAFSAIDWNTAGENVANFFLMLPSLITGWIQETDWKVVGTSLSTFVKSGFGKVTAWIQETDWLKIGESIATFIANIDWGGITSALFEGVGAALGGLTLFVWGLIKDAWASVVAWWEEVAYQDGQFTMEGLLRGIGDVFANIGNWLKENVVDPFVNGFKSLFDIHSPSKLMSGLGGYVIDGFLGGILDGLRGIGNWINQHVITPFVSGFKALRNGVVDVVEGMVNSIIRGINKLLSGLNEFLDLGKHVGLDLSIPTIPEVRLPRAAKGTIVSKATNLTVGEDGTEAIMPLERHTEWIDVLASKLAAKTGGTSGGGGGGSAVIQIFLGNRKVTEHVIKDINQITRENGVCPIHV